MGEQVTDPENRKIPDVKEEVERKVESITSIKAKDQRYK